MLCCVRDSDGNYPHRYAKTLTLCSKIPMLMKNACNFAKRQTDTQTHKEISEEFSNLGRIAGKRLLPTRSRNGELPRP